MQGKETKPAHHLPVACEKRIIARTCNFARCSCRFWTGSSCRRRQATAELNKGESRHSHGPAVAFHTVRPAARPHRGPIAAKGKRAGAGHGAIALWNTVYLGRALDALHASGEAIPDALLAHVAPSGWQHINLTGDYLGGVDGNLGPDEFRLGGACGPDDPHGR